MFEIRSTSCCGMRELGDIGGGNKTAEQVLRELCLNLPPVYDYAQKRNGHFKLAGRTINFNLVVFTGVVIRMRGDNSNERKDNYGEQLASLITNEGLGVVVPSATGVNPNTGNTIQAWVWTVDSDRLAAYAAVIDEESEKKREKQAHEFRRIPAAGLAEGFARSNEEYWRSLGFPALRDSSAQRQQVRVYERVSSAWDNEPLREYASTRFRVTPNAEASSEAHPTEHP